MRAVVISDSHGDYTNVRRILLSQSKAEVVFFCGDGIDELETLKNSFPEKMFIMVKGNCDWGKKYQTTEFFTLNGKKIMITHGHRYQVKSAYDFVISTAKENGCDVLLFGHTHSAYTDYVDGLYIMNPGSAHGTYGSYGILDITDKGIVMNVVNLVS